MGTFKSGIIIDSIMRRKKAPKFNPFNPKDRARVEGKIFSDEWVKHNLWMGDENKKAMTKAQEKQKRMEYEALVSDCPTKIRMPTFEQWLEEPELMIEFMKNMPNFEDFHPPILFNFQKPVPIPIIREDMEQYEAWEKKQDEKMAIFKEMMGEKGIRAGRAGIGEAHKGWGRSKRKY